MAHQFSWSSFAQWDQQTRQTELEKLGKAVWAETAVFQQSTDMLAYQSQLPYLITLLKTAWHTLQDDKTSNEWQQQTVTALLTDSLIFQYLETPSPNKIEQANLVQQLQSYINIDAEGLERYLAHLNGYTQYNWQLEHLAEHPPQNMAALLIEFLAFAYREASVPHGRTNLLRHLLPTYFVERRTGQLNPRQDLGDLMRSGRSLPKPPASHHPLAPDSDTLQRFFAKLLNYDPVRPYPPATIFSLLPLWLRFLQARHLLTNDEATTCLADLQTLQPDLLTYYQNFTEDASLVTAVADSF